MKTFSQFISEALNKPYDFEDEGKEYGTHSYSWDDDKGGRFHADVIDMDKHGKHASVEFKTNGSFEPTGQSGHGAVRHFATMRAIMKHHRKAHPEVEKYTFSSEKTVDEKNPEKFSENSRNKLYKRFTAAAGGVSSSNPEDQNVRHTIPAKNIR